MTTIVHTVHRLLPKIVAEVKRRSISTRAQFIKRYRQKKANALRAATAALGQEEMDRRLQAYRDMCERHGIFPYGVKPHAISAPLRMKAGKSARRAKVSMPKLKFMEDK
jgi:hypothetical protein